MISPETNCFIKTTRSFKAENLYQRMYSDRPGKVTRISTSSLRGLVLTIAWISCEASSLYVF